MNEYIYIYTITVISIDLYLIIYLQISYKEYCIYNMEYRVFGVEHFVVHRFVFPAACRTPKISENLTNKQICTQQTWFCGETYLMPADFHQIPHQRILQWPLWKTIEKQHNMYLYVSDGSFFIYDYYFEYMRIYIYICGMCVCVCIVPTWGKSQNVKPKFQKSFGCLS